jgi:hypothetical protein
MPPRIFARTELNALLARILRRCWQADRAASTMIIVDRYGAPS